MKAIFFITVLLFVASVPSAFAADVPEIKKDCSICHASNFMEGGELLKGHLSALCIGCHPDRVEADHPVDVAPSMPVEVLPLDIDGRMTCATCHDPHGRAGFGHMLRVRPESLCGRCHRK